jgi:3-oxoacyl-[acyl-carrier protein] reductase
VTGGDKVALNEVEKRMTRLKDYGVIVTGSGRGIGKSIAHCCIEEGARVVINDVNPTTLEEARISLSSKGGKVIAFEGDVSKRSVAQKLIDLAISEFGRLDVLVNNAAIARNGPFLELTEEDWDEVIRVDLKGPFHCAQLAARHMARQKTGRIINISSRAYLGAPEMANYGAAKAGLVGLTRCMAMELGPYGITVNAIAPGVIDTELTRISFASDDLKERIQKTPLRRLGYPEDIAHAVLFLASPEAGFITGEVLHVTGGPRLNYNERCDIC